MTPTLSRRHTLLAGIVVAAATVVVFAPALRNGFVDWDDNLLLLDNLHYRGLGWAQIRWMFTTALLGHWTPITWLTLGADYTLWGMNPAGYHATSVLLHAATAVVVFAIAVRLLAAAMPATGERARTGGAAVAALVFAIHPLRVESVAWVTERRDVVSGLLYLVTVLAYLWRAEGRRPGTWLTVSLVVYALALGSKVVAITLPLLLAVLDVYPLRRLPPTPGAWLTPAARRLWLEKVPWAVLAVAAGGASLLTHAAYLTPVDAQGPGGRVLMAAYATVFYLRKTLVPAGLTAQYELPQAIRWVDPRFASAVVLVVAISVTLWKLRRRWPAGLTAWIAYLALLLPVSGLVHAGHHLVAERYSYLACLPWALLAGGGFAWLLHLPRETLAPGTRKAAIGGLVLALVGLGGLAAAQVTAWRDTETLWRYALDVDPDCALCHNQLAAELGNRGLLAPAVAHFERAVALRPDAIGIRANLALALVRAGRIDDAITQWRVVLDRRPRDVGIATQLAATLLRQGRAAEAVTTLEPVVRAVPNAPAARATLARAYRAVGQPAAADEQIETLRRLDAR